MLKMKLMAPVFTSVPNAPTSKCSFGGRAGVAVFILLMALGVPCVGWGSTNDYELCLQEAYKAYDLKAKEIRVKLAGDLQNCQNLSPSESEAECRELSELNSQVELQKARNSLQTAKKFCWINLENTY